MDNFLEFSLSGSPEGRGHENVVSSNNINLGIESNITTDKIIYNKFINLFIGSNKTHFPSYFMPTGNKDFIAPNLSYLEEISELRAHQSYIQEIRKDYHSSVLSMLEHKYELLELRRNYASVLEYINICLKTQY
jgi:hypothetical protein